jgi:hypothetical protein
MLLPDNRIAAVFSLALITQSALFSYQQLQASRSSCSGLSLGLARKTGTTSCQSVIALSPMLVKSGFQAFMGLVLSLHIFYLSTL